MTRWSPPPPDGEYSSLGHDAVALYLFVASVAATVVLVSSMCSAWGRRAKPAVSQEPDGSDAKSGGTESGQGESKEVGGDEKEDEEEVVTLSPDLVTRGPVAAAALPSTTSKRKLSMSLSKIPDKIKSSRRERRDIKDAPEDTLWKKAIILGEKCKIPGERDGQGADDADADADEMAAGTFRRSNYSRPVSRSTSFAVQQPANLPPPPAMQSAT